MSHLPPKRPYFLRALHEWLSDNEFTPYVMIDATYEGVMAPLEYAQDGKLVLSLSYTATKDLVIDNDGIYFLARFGGVSQSVSLPMASVLGIYAKEDQSHAVFFDPSEYPAVLSGDNKPKKPKPVGKPSFKVIK